MSPLPPDRATRHDPLLDAYRQASEREGARPGAQVRSAVLSHARVVAQSRPLATHGSLASAVSQAVLDAPAANDRAPLWRLAAGVVIGLVGVWIFQLTRPEATPENSTASVSGSVTASAPQVATASSEPSVAAKPAAVAPPETSVAAAVAPAPVLSQPAAAPRASDETRTRSMAASPPPNASENNVASRDTAADQARLAPSEALAKIPVPFAAAPTPEVASGSTADAASGEMVIASAETRKSARASASTSASAPMPAPPSSPVAFPAVSPEAAIAPAPAPAAQASAARAMGGSTGSVSKATSATAPSRRTEVSGRSAWAGWSNDADQALFKALNAGDLPSLRAAIARGANVNARDERGRTALQVARERADAEAVRALEAAGAR